MKSRMSRLNKVIALAAVVAAIFYLAKTHIENQQLKKIIQRLSADSRAAEVIVTDVRTDSKTEKTYTTIKFLEYDSNLRPLEAKYFTFSENIIQFQSMVIRFDDFYVQKGHPLRGKSAYLFMKAFVLTGQGAEIFDIAKVNEIPSGYKAQGVNDRFQAELWRKFWDYALNPLKAKRMGIKNAQIEAPGTKFVPGMMYTIKIEHDGGLRIDTLPLPAVLNNEKIRFQ